MFVSAGSKNQPAGLAEGNVGEPSDRWLVLAARSGNKGLECSLCHYARLNTGEGWGGGAMVQKAGSLY